MSYITLGLHQVLPSQVRITFLVFESLRRSILIFGHSTGPPGHHSQMLSPTEAAEWLSPPLSHRQISPQPTHPSPPHEERITPSTLRHPPLLDPNASAPQPELIRTSQIPSTPAVNPFGGGTFATYSNKAILKLQGDLNQMAMGWSNEEWTNRRRLIQFWRQQEGNVINATFRPIGQQDFVPNSIVISCVFRDDWNECFVTSVDAIYLLEALVGVRFSVEEKNRIRRNLEGFKPMTVSKSKVESEPFFKLIMGFPNPKPRNIEKDVKVFPWKILSSALKKIISKYVSILNRLHFFHQFLFCHQQPTIDIFSFC